MATIWDSEDEPCRLFHSPVNKVERNWKTAEEPHSVTQALKVSLQILQWAQTAGSRAGLEKPKLTRWDESGCWIITRWWEWWDTVNSRYTVKVESMGFAARADVGCERQRKVMKCSYVAVRAFHRACIHRKRFWELQAEKSHFFCPWQPRKF